MSRSPTLHALRVAAIACLVVGCVAATVEVAAPEVPFPAEERAARAIDPVLLRAACRMPGPIVVVPQSSGAVGVAATTVDRLVAAGIPAGLRWDFAWAAGSAHVVEHPRTELLAVVGEPVAQLLQNRRYAPIADYDPWTRAEHAELDRLLVLFPFRLDARATLHRSIHRHPRAWQRYLQLRAEGDRVAVFVAPSPSGTGTSSRGARPLLR